MKRNVNSRKKLSDFELFTLLNDAVSNEYWQDACKAGLITSKISHDPPSYYVAIARYHSSHAHKEVIVAQQAKTMEEALRNVAKMWLSKVLPPSAVNLKERLRDILG